MKRAYNQKPHSTDGREIVRTDSRPQGYTTCFTSRGDSLTGIGDGKIIEWDFSNTDDTVTAPSGYKRKKIEFGFSEAIYIKEGTFYFHNAPKGCYIDFYIVCKAGGYYKDPNGLINGTALGLDAEDFYSQAVEDTIITTYVNHHLIQGSVPMGDELNTEGASESSLPTQQQGYVLVLEVTTPSSDSVSNGSVEMEIYRERTILLPNEAL